MSDGIMRVVESAFGNVPGEEAALRIIVGQQRKEIDRLAAEVERLRITPQEREAIADCADAAEAYMNDDIAATLRGLQARHERATVAE